MKLELKHLAPYLPYGLSFSVNLKDVRDNFPDELRTLKLAETNIDLALKDRNGLKQVVIVKDLESLPKEKQKCIKSIAPAKGGGVRVEFYDKLAGLDRLSKMLGWDEPARSEVNIMSKFTDDELEEKIE